MATDPTISLAAQSPQIDLASIYGAAMQLRQMQQQMQTQNALRWVMSQPDATDDKGNPTPNTLKRVMQVDPNYGTKLAAQVGQAEEREAQKVRLQSETQTAAMTQHREALRSALDVYDEELADGNTSPDIARNTLMGTMKEYVDGLPIGNEQKAAYWGKLSTMQPAQLRTLAKSWEMSDEERRQQDISRNKIRPDVIDGKTVFVADAADDEGKPIIKDVHGKRIEPEGLIERQGTSMDPTRAAQGQQHLAQEAERIKQGYERLSIEEKKAADASASFTPEMGALMASMAEHGVSVPAGFRSKAQQSALYRALLDRNPDKSPDEIANLVKTGQIEFGAQKKETQTAAGVAGRIEVAQNEISNFIPLVEEAARKVPRSAFPRVNQLLQMADKEVGDSNLKALKIRINSLLNAYDQLASRGGTDKDKRAEVRGLLTSADSPKALEEALKSFALEAEAAHKAAVAATRVPELERGGGNKANAEIARPTSKSDYDALPHGAHYSKPGDQPGTYRVKP